MGKYLTGIETRMIRSVFDAHGWPKVLLDVGGGDGRFAKRLVNDGVMPIVIEYDVQPILELKQSGWALPVVRADGLILPFKEKSADALICIEVASCTDAEHNSALFEEARRVLKDKGILIFTTENRQSVAKIIKVINRRRYAYNGFEYYSETCADTQAKLERQGYCIIEKMGFRWIPFTRKSENSVIAVFSALERVFNLKHFPDCSPWILWVARKGNGSKT